MRNSLLRFSVAAALVAAAASHLSACGQKGALKLPAPANAASAASAPTQ
jgi:predicted small lipoprotein YifL